MQKIVKLCTLLCLTAHVVLSQNSDCGENCGLFPGLGKISILPDLSKNTLFPKLEKNTLLPDLSKNNLIPDLSNNQFLNDLGKNTLIQDLRNKISAFVNTVKLILRIDTDECDFVTLWCSNRLCPEPKQVKFEEKYASNFIDPKLRTVFVIHGFLDSKNSTWIGRLVTKTLTFEDVNVCLVDWSPMSQQVYTVAASQVVRTGKQLAKYMQKLIAAGSMSLDRMTVIGHSFGAHIAGVAGYYLDGLLDAIIGLDPAGKLVTRPFLLPSDRRLDPSDAKFVQVIHTDMWKWGSNVDMGHQDFYANVSDKNQSRVKR